MALAFETTAAITAPPDLPKWTEDDDGGGVKLLPPARYTQSSGADRTNACAALGLPRATFEAVGTSGAGAPAPVLRIELTNGGALQPMDVGAPILRVGAKFKPVSPNGGPDTPPDSAPFELSFGVMWTPGPGAAPNNAGVFSLVNPLPAARFTAFGVAHEMRITGLRVPDAAEGLQGRKTWWNDKGPWSEAEGYGAVVVALDGGVHAVELLGEVRVV